MRAQREGGGRFSGLGLKRKVTGIRLGQGFEISFTHAPPEEFRDMLIRTMRNRIRMLVYSFVLSLCCKLMHAWVAESDEQPPFCSDKTKS